MKELSIEEKAQRYDEALEIIIDYYQKIKYSSLSNVSTDREVLEKAFPELKESEDERIRKELIDFIYDKTDTYELREKSNSWLAWLEKQDYTFEIKKGHWYKCVCDYMLNGSDLMFKNDRLYYCRSDWRLGGEIDERNVKDIGVNGYKSFFRPATNQEIKDWLEKLQGKSALEVAKEEKVDSQNCIKYYAQEHIGDKVEPKFKVGDWLFHEGSDNALHISRIINHIYVSDEGATISFSRQNNWRLWTIQDAKDGDVLFHSDSASNGIFIFKELLKYEFNEKVICYCDYDSEDHFCLGESHTCCLADAKILHPATKEQRDLLFRKMHEAGYEWDFEKKELKKIEQNPAWSEEDERIYKSIIYSFAHNYPLTVQQQEFVKSLESLKDGVRPKQEWSEEDERNLNDAILFIETGTYSLDKDSLINWLKSLKSQSQWKPSDEQMNLLEELVEDNNQRHFYTVLKSLYEQLKKLKE